MFPFVPGIGTVDMVGLRDNVLSAPTYGGTYQDYPWDRWEKAAAEAGVSADLVQLGRAIFREAFQHQWLDHLQVEAGWLDGGCTMIYQSLAFPVECRRRWTHLMEMDGDSDEAMAPPVSTDIKDLADRLKVAGIATGIP